MNLVTLTNSIPRLNLRNMMSPRHQCVEPSSFASLRRRRFGSNPSHSSHSSHLSHLSHRAAVAGAAAAAVVAFGAVAQQTSLDRITVGAEAPEIRLPDLDGTMIEVLRAPTPAKVIVFGDVRQNRTHDGFKAIANAIRESKNLSPGGENEDEVERVYQTFLVTATGRSASAIRKDLRSWDEDRPDHVLIDSDRTVFEAYGIAALPTLVVVDRDHRIVAHVAGLMPGFGKTARDGVRNAVDEKDADTKPSVGDEVDAADDERAAPAPRDGQPLGAGAGEEARRHHRLAGRLAAMGYRDKAISEYRRAVEIDPELVDARIRLGQLLMLGDEFEGRNAEAERHFKKAAALAPGNPDARLGLVWVALAREGLEASEREAARDAVAEILDSHPRHAKALYLMGMVYERRGDALNAMEYYRRAVESMMGMRGDGSN